MHNECNRQIDALHVLVTSEIGIIKISVTKIGLFQKKNRNPPIEDINFSSFTTPWISNTKKENPLDIQPINFVSPMDIRRLSSGPPGYPRTF